MMEFPKAHSLYFRKLENENAVRSNIEVQNCTEEDRDPKSKS